MEFTPLTGREYQVQLKTPPFTNPSRAVDRLAALLKRFEAVTLRRKSEKENAFEQSLFDTATGDFAAAGLRLRMRLSAEKISYTYKAASRDRYSAAAVKTGSKHKSAKTKLEENIYSFHSLYTRQTTVEPDKARALRTVADWTTLFPAAATVCPKASPLQATSVFFVRPGELELDFGGTRCPATLELKYSDKTRLRLAGVEFSFRHTVADEEFPAQDVRRIRSFYAALVASTAVDRAVDLTAAQRQTGL